MVRYENFADFLSTNFVDVVVDVSVVVVVVVDVSVVVVLSFRSDIQKSSHNFLFQNYSSSPASSSASGAYFAKLFMLSGFPYRTKTRLLLLVNTGHATKMSQS